MANLKIQKWLKGHRTRMGQPEKDGNWEMESHKRQSFLSSLPGYLSWYGSPLWGTVCLACRHLSQVQRLCSMPQLQISGEGTLDQLEPGGYMSALINGGQRNGVHLKTAAREALWAGHTLQKGVPIANLKFLFILIILCSLNSKILQKASITDALPEKPNTIMYIYTYTKFLFFHILTYHFLL